MVDLMHEKVVMHGNTSKSGNAQKVTVQVRVHGNA